jgi:hypothetical protein
MAPMIRQLFRSDTFQARSAERDAASSERQAPMEAEAIIWILNITLWVLVVVAVVAKTKKAPPGPSRAGQ